MAFDHSIGTALQAMANPSPSEVSRSVLDDAVARLAGVGYDCSRTPNATKALRAYLAGKPLLLTGTAGVGKSAFFVAIQQSGVCRTPIVMLSLLERGHDFASTIQAEVRGYEDYDVVVDDFGAESTWGGRRSDDFLAGIIAVREKSRRRTHYTTNLTRDQIRDRYDERVRSRLRICECFPMVGADKRHTVVPDAELEFNARCADPASWRVCSEQCPMYCGSCGRGVTVPPAVRGVSPRTMCGLGSTIPYRDEYLRQLDTEREERRRRYAEMGIPSPNGA